MKKSTVLGLLAASLFVIASFLGLCGAAAAARETRPSLSPTRSRAHGVSMSFPHGWQVEAGAQGGPVLLARRGRASIAVTARRGEPELDFGALSADRLDGIARAAVRVVRESYPEAKAETAAFVGWAGRPALALRYQGRFGHPYACTAFRIETVRAGRWYAVTVMAPRSEYEELKGSITDAIASFAVEAGE